MVNKKKILFVCLGIIVVIIIFLVTTILIKGKEIVVLMYHGVDDTKNDYAISCKDFEKQIKYLVDNHYETIFVEDIYKNHRGKKSIALTFDDGYENFYQNVFPILKKYKLKANLYIITSAIDGVGYLTHKQIKEMSDSSLVSIGSHTENHTPLTYLGEKDIINELEISKQKLEKITGKKIKTISYPNGEYDDYIIALAKNYYKYGLTTIPKTNMMKNNHQPYEINRYGIGKDTSLLTFKKILLHSSIYRY